MNGRMYKVPFSAAVTVAQDLLEFNPATAKPIRLRRLFIGQSSDTDSEQLEITIKRGATTSGSGGSAPTPRPTCSSDSAAGFTAEANNTTRATGGSPITLGEFGFNVLNGVDICFIPEETDEAVNGERLVIGLETTPADSLTIQGTAVIEELG